MRRVNFVDGEGVVYSDFNMLEQIVDRNFSRRMFTKQYLGTDVAFDHTLRLIPSSDSTYNFLVSHSGTGSRTLTVNRGYFAQPTGSSDQDVPDCKFGEYAGGSFTLDANTSGSVYRRDILQAKIDTESTTTSTSRDFKDATTGVVTSQSVDKRRVQNVLVSIKKGTDQSSAANADANEPAPDSGYVKLYSFRIDNAGTASIANDWDYNLPIGGGKLLVPAGSMVRNYTNAAPKDEHTQGGYVVLADTVNYQTVAAQFPCRAPQFPVRLMGVNVRAAPHDYGGSLLVKLYNPTDDSYFDLTAGVVAASNEVFQQYSFPSQFPTRPLWHNGNSYRDGTTKSYGWTLSWTDKAGGGFVGWVGWVEFTFAGRIA